MAKEPSVAPIIVRDYAAPDRPGVFPPAAVPQQRGLASKKPVAVVRPPPPPPPPPKKK